MSEKNNVEEVKISGVSTFFLYSIPWILGMAALVWLAFLTGLVEFSHSQSAYAKRQTYEGRREERVGVNGEILKPVDLIFSNRGCFKIERAFLDTQTLTIYIHNTCAQKREFAHYTVKEYAPDGTIVHSVNEYLPTDDAELDAGDKIEIETQTSSDARVVKIVVGTDGGR
jgi:hypothetical protein